MKRSESGDSSEPGAEPGGDRPAAKAERTNFKVLNIRIPKDIHKALRRISIDADQNLQNTVIRALAEDAGSRRAES